jgi:hypothetical protein
VGHYFKYSLHEFALLSRRRSRKGGGEEKHGEATGFPADNGRQLGPLQDALTSTLLCIADDEARPLMMARGPAAASGRTPCIASHFSDAAQHRSGRESRARNPISSARFFPPVSAASKDTRRPVTFAGRLNPMFVGKKSSACGHLITAPCAFTGLQADPGLR